MNEPYMINFLLHNPINSVSVPNQLYIDPPDFEKNVSFLKFRVLEILRREWPALHPDPSTVVFHAPQVALELMMLEEDEAWIQHNPVQSVAKRFLRKVKLLPDVADDNTVHLLVTVNSLPPAAIGDLEQEEEDVAAGLSPPDDQYYKRFRALSKRARSMTPSKVSKSKEYAKHQASPDSAIYDGMYTTARDGSPAVITIAPPIELFHPIFSQFLNKIRNPMFTPDIRSLKTVSQLMTKSSAISTSEKAFAKTVREELTQILCRYMGKSGMTDDDRVADARIALMLADMDISLVLAELKRAMGEGGSDALTQASISALNNWNEDSRAVIRNRTCCPMFLVTGGGPYMAILGVIWTDKFVVQRLTDLMWLGEARTSEDPRIYRLARVFMALRESIPLLEKFYEDIYDNRHTIPEPQPGVPHPRFFPYPNAFKSPNSTAFITFQYIRPLESDSTCVTFLAETTTEPKGLVVVKFVDRYGYEVHDHMAQRGKAPALLYCGLLDGKTDSRRDAKARSALHVNGLYDGPWRMVVMDYLEGATAEQVNREQWPVDAYAQLEAMIAKDLHGKGYVFGDLREANVMFVKQKVYLIDFDWAGKDGEVYYPKGVAAAPGRVSGREFELITMEDDDSMLAFFN